MLPVTITTAHTLSSPLFSKIQNAVVKKYGKEVEFVQLVDESVLGGIRILIGSKEIDATVSGKLQQVKKQLEAEI